MRRALWFSVFLACCLLVAAGAARAQLPMTGAGLGTPVSGPAGCSQSAAFLARTSGLDTAHQNAYKTMICGMVTDGTFAKLDVLYVFATSTSTIALLNIIQNSFNGTANSSPTFTADAGYTGNGSSAFIASGFNPSTASSPNFTTNSASTFVWDNSTSDNHVPVFGYNATANATVIYPLFSGTEALTEINSLGFVTFSGSSPQGFWSITTAGSSSDALYLNGSSVATNSGSHSAPQNDTFIVLAANGQFSNDKIMVSGWGGQLSSTDQSNLYSRIHTYLQTIAGIP